MPVVGTVDVAVHLYRVHNIDLFCRGVYYLRTSLLRCSKPKQNGRESHDAAGGGDKKGGGGGENAGEQQVEAHGIPYMCLAQCEDMGTTVSNRKVPPLKEPRLQGPAVNGHHYHTRMFVIRYRDEELELGEVVNFQIPVELDAGRRWLEAGQTLVLQMELMFSKLASLETDGNASKKATNGAGGSGGSVEEEEESEEEKELTFEPVAVQRFEASLSGGHWGLHAYVPVTFSGVHFVRVDCMVHGVLRNLKLEAPKPSDEAASRLSNAAAAKEAKAEAAIEVDNSAAAERPTRASSQDETAASSEDLEESLPASLDRLGVRDDDDAGAAATAAATPNKAPPPTYDWFSLYDEQGVGGRRISTPPIDSSSAADSQAAGGRSNGDGGSGSGGGDEVPDSRKSNQSSGKAESSWRWGWGRKGTGNSSAPKAVVATSPEKETGATAETAAAAATLSPVTVEETTAGCPGGKATQRDRTEKLLGGGGEEHDNEQGEGLQELEVLSTLEGGSSPGPGEAAAAAAAAESGRSLARDVERERQRLRRKDVYSYFMMPLMRALEAQMGTTAWLRKLLEAESSKEIPTSAVPLWLPPDPNCEQDVTRVLRRLFASSIDVANIEDGQQGQQSSQLADKAKEGGAKSVAGISDARGGCYSPPPAAKVSFPALIARYCRGGDGWEGQGLGWLHSDETTCKALELDVHALAMLVFVEWREFVSALPGCGAVLSKETSALWFAQIRQRWACQATLHTCSAVQRPPQGATVTSTVTRPSSPAFDSSGRPSKMPASALGAPLLSRLEPEIAAEHFGAAVRMACEDASAPYKLPLQDQHMFPDGDAALPVCLIQRYEHREEEEEDGKTEQRDGSSGGYVSAAADRSSSAVAVVNTEQLIVAGRSPPVSPVWVPTPQPAFGPASTLPVDSPLPPSRIWPSRTAPVSPIAAPSRNPRDARAASASPRAGDVRATVGTVDVATASAAVAAAVAAATPTSTDEDRSGSSSPQTPAAQKFRGFGRGGRSRSLSPPGMQTAAAAATTAGVGVGAAGAGGKRRDTGMSLKSLSPLRMKGRGFFSPSKSRWLKSPGRKRSAAAASEGGGALNTNAAGDDSSRAGDDDAQPDGELEDAGGTGDGNSGRSSSGSDEDSNESTGKNNGAGMGCHDNRECEAPPPPPPPDITPPPTQRGSNTPSPLRKSPVASPARPPLKPMAAEQHQRQQQQQQGRQGQSAGTDSGSSTGSGSGSGSARAGRKNDRASLLDGVEQSSDLGAFFRQGNGGQGGAGRRRGRGASPRRRGGSPKMGRSPRTRARELRRYPRRGDSVVDSSSRGSRKDQDEDEDEDEEEEEGEEEDDDDEEENARGAGVGVHVIVLHHGYCGSSMDMRLIKNYIRILAPKALLLNAESNERNQHASMRIMGEKLAKEVHRFLTVRARSLLLPGGQGRLSFIGHSAGAVIIRAALTSPSLLPALGRLHMFVSLGSPHLGTVYGSSGIVRTGMWAMKRWTKSKLLEELGLTDAPQPRDTLLCWLSQQPGLEYFRHVVLVSADKDGYVPSQSARVQMCDASIRDAEREVPHGQVVCEMTRALLGPINDDSLYRLHLWGGEKQANSGGGGMDEYIGRTAHISMMDSPSLVCLLLCTLIDLIR